MKILIPNTSSSPQIRLPGRLYNNPHNKHSQTTLSRATRSFIYLDFNSSSFATERHYIHNWQLNGNAKDHVQHVEYIECYSYPMMQQRRPRQPQQPRLAVRLIQQLVLHLLIFVDFQNFMHFMAAINTCCNHAYQTRIKYEFVAGNCVCVCVCATFVMLMTLMLMLMLMRLLASVAGSNYVSCSQTIV